MSYIFDALQRSDKERAEFKCDPLPPVMVGLLQAAEKRDGGPAQPSPGSECQDCRAAVDAEALFCEACGGFQGSVVREADESEGANPGQESPADSEAGASRGARFSARIWNRVLLWLVVLTSLTLLLALVRHVLGIAST